MTSDRELLELAAKAAGYTLVENCDMHGEYWPWCNELADNWCPLTSDSDALRLAVKLGLAVSIEYNFGSTMVIWGPPIASVREEHNDDPYAATRRAIVRAAAEIGKE